MSSLIIRGGHRLSGIIEVNGAKNAVLPLMAAALLGGESHLHHVPQLADVAVMGQILRCLGAIVRFEADALYIDASELHSQYAPYELVSQMRASMLVMGPLLARYGRASVAMPGGCAIGTRPIDLHLKGFAALGASIRFEHGLVHLEAAKLRGASVYLDFPSVGATENIMAAACLAEGTTIIENAATEPEIVDLAEYLCAAGARIYHAGSSVIQIDGVPEMRGASHRVIGDRIEAGTYLMAAAITGGDCTLLGIQPKHLQAAIAKLGEMGCRFELYSDALRLLQAEQPLRAVHVTTLPYPGFPTDLQAQIMALLTLADGNSIITETVFENRFLHAEELKRMGANIHLDGRNAFVQGVKRLSSAQVMARDLRGGAALVIAALAAEGETRIYEYQHLERGYGGLIAKLQQLGATCGIAAERSENMVTGLVAQEPLHSDEETF